MARTAPTLLFEIIVDCFQGDWRTKRRIGHEDFRCADVLGAFGFLRVRPQLELPPEAAQIGCAHPMLFHRTTRTIGVILTAIPYSSTLVSDVRKCAVSYRPGDGRFPARAATHILILAPAENLDAERTRAIFGHPAGDILKFRDSTGRERALDLSHQFRAIGNAFGVFSYEGEFYFDTFYSALGDLENERVEAPYVTDTLAVLKRKGDETRLVCELLWHDSDHRWDKWMGERNQK